MPPDAVRPVSAKMWVRISTAIADAVGMPRRFFGHVETGSSSLALKWMMPLLEGVAVIGEQ
jgi:hypothetical protein